MFSSKNGLSDVTDRGFYEVFSRCINLKTLILKMPIIYVDLVQEVSFYKFFTSTKLISLKLFKSWHIPQIYDSCHSVFNHEKFQLKFLSHCSCLGLTVKVLGLSAFCFFVCGVTLPGHSYVSLARLEFYYASLSIASL